jgi:acyl carrier protein
MINRFHILLCTSVIMLLSACSNPEPKKSGPNTTSENKQETVKPDPATEATVRSIVADVLERNGALFDTETSLASQGANQLDCSEIILMIEERFKVRFPDADLNHWKKLSINRCVGIAGSGIKGNGTVTEQ